MRLIQGAFLALLVASISAQFTFPCTVPGLIPTVYQQNTFSTSGISFVLKSICNSTRYGDPDLDVSLFKTAELTPYGAPNTFNNAYLGVFSDPAETQISITRVRPAPYIYTIVLVDVSGSQLAYLPNITNYIRNNLTTTLNSFNYSRVATATFDGRSGMQLVSDYGNPTDSLNALAGRLSGYQPVDNSTNLIGALQAAYNYSVNQINSDSILNGRQGQGMILVLTNMQETAYRPQTAMPTLRPEFNTLSTVFLLSGNNFSQPRLNFGAVTTINTPIFSLLAPLGITPATINITDPLRDQLLTQQFQNMASNATYANNGYYLFRYCSQARGPTGNTFTGSSTLSNAGPRILSVNYGTSYINVPFDATNFGPGCTLKTSGQGLLVPSFSIIAMALTLLMSRSRD